MTKKHFIAIARVVNLISDSDTRKMVAYNLALIFRDVNKNFDKDKFVKACGV